MAMSRDQGNRIISPHARGIFQCITEGVADYPKKVPARLRKTFHPRTRANAVRDFIVERITTQFERIPGTRTDEYRGLFFLAIGEETVIRFNKLETDFTCSTNSTQQALAFLNQTPIPQQLEFSSIPAHATHLVAGYVPNAAFTAASSVYIACPEGERNAWEIELLPEANVISIDEHRTTEQPETRRSKVVGKDRQNREKDKSNADDDQS